MNIFVMTFKWIVTFLCLLLLSACDELNLGNDSGFARNKTVNKMNESAFFYPLKEATLKTTKEKTVYIPVYSEIFVSGGGKLNLAITLSIRNTDFTYPLLVSHVNYYNTAGELIENYLPMPYLLKPMASTHFFVTQTDKRGGVGANFIINWSANKIANEPVIEAVMAGSTGTQGMAFVSSGRAIKSKTLTVGKRGE